eukprot:COSAG06_NODE_38492_length_432_cov_0.660494_1_plen_60_part_10
MREETVGDVEATRHRQPTCGASTIVSDTAQKRFLHNLRSNINQIERRIILGLHRDRSEGA